MTSTAARISHSLTVTTSPAFNFWLTVYSHGWYSLPPFSVDSDRKELTRVLDLPGGRTVQCTISGSSGKIAVNYRTRARLGPADRKLIRKDIEAMFRLDEDFTDFHRTIGKIPAYRWIASMRAGRLLRAPTVFEDMVKMICTTNCTWSLTTLMTTNLVGLFGNASDNGFRGFPSATLLAGTTEQFLRREVKAGYRAPYLLQLADRVASGKLDPEQWRDPRIPTEELLKSLLAVKGIGPYAAQNVLRLLGRYDFLALDSWVRSKYYSLYHKGRSVKDRTIESRYSRYGEWRGLVFWMEMTRDWHDEKFSSAGS